VHESPCFYNGQYLLDENVSIVSQNIKFILKNIFIFLIFLLFHVILLFTIVPFITSIETFFYSSHFLLPFLIYLLNKYFAEASLSCRRLLYTFCLSFRIQTLCHPQHISHFHPRDDSTHQLLKQHGKIFIHEGCC